MKWLLRSVPLFALVWVGCSASNTPVTDTTVIDTTIVKPNAPTITKFSPDTVWTLGTLTIYGTHFGYGNDVSVAIDTTQVRVSSTYDTVMTVNIPETAQTGLIHVGTINGRTTSTKPVVVENTFSPGTINDSLPIGASFSIPGTGMNHYHGQLRLTIAGVLYPIDSVFANRIVSHVVTNAFSGAVIVYDSSGSHNAGTLAVTRPSSWNTLSVIWDHLNVTETHTRTGYINGPSNPIDSTWEITATYLGQHDVNVSGVPFARTQTGLQYAAPDPAYTNVPLLSIAWDTVTQTATVSYLEYSSSETATLTLDTVWNSGTTNLSALLPVDNAIEFTFPYIGYQITEDSTDTQGLVNWQETTNYTALNSGSFHVILKP
jgi:hypothetical protein